MQHNGGMRDRFNASYMLTPGGNEVRVPLSEVARAPRGQRLDLGHVRSLIVFANQLGFRRDLVLHTIRLEP